MSSRLPLLACCVAVAVLAAQTAYLQPWTLDDAYISFRYAANWAAGIGPVYNAGERCEGYTTFLWVAMLAGGRSLGFDPDPLAKGLGLLSVLGTFVGLATSGRWLPESSHRAAAASVVLLATSGLLGAWGASGMETPLVAFLSSAALGLHVRSLSTRAPAEAVGAGLLGGLAMMTRPDAALVTGVALLDRLLRRQWREAVVQGTAFGLLVGPWWAWRWSYYGWPLPNTFYAKVGATSAQLARGVAYLSELLLATGPLWLVALAALWLARRERHAAVLPVWVAVHAAYVVAVGGDGMPAWRFFVATMPVVAWLAGVALVRVPVAAAVPVFVALIGWQGWQATHHPELTRRILHGDVGRNGLEVGRWLADHVPEGTLLATNAAGAVPYASGLPTIDMLGLNDCTISHAEVDDMGARKAGHEKADGAYVMSRRPDLVLFGGSRGSKKAVFASDRELLKQPGFREAYVQETHRLPSGATLTLWRRRAFPALAE